MADGWRSDLAGTWSDIWNKLDENSGSLEAIAALLLIVSTLWLLAKKSRSKAAQVSQAVSRAAKPTTSNTILLGDFPRDRDLLGRDSLLEQMQQSLHDLGRTAIVQGLGGIGKSALARAYASDNEHRYEGILWVDAENLSGLVAGLLRLEPHLEISNLPVDDKTARAKALLACLRNRRWLVVYDNVEDEEFLLGWWPPNGVDTIVTSRWKDWSADVAEITPDTLKCDEPEDAGPQLLMEEARRYDDPEAAVSLAHQLDGLPLALVVAGALVRAGQSFAEVQADLEAVLSKTETARHGGSLTAAVGLSYDKLSDKARTLIDLMAWMAPEGVEARLFTDVPGSERSPGLLAPIDDDLRALCKDPGAVRAALRELESRSLIGRSGAGYDMHRLTADALRARQGDHRAERAGAAAAVLAASYPHVYSSTYSECTRLTPHVLAFRRAVGADAPALAAVDYLYNQTAIYLREIAQRDAALDLARESLRLKEARLGEADYDVAIGYSVLGLALMEAGELSAAVAAQRRNVKLCEDHNHGAAALATGLNNLSSALSAQGRASGDRALLEEALQTTERTLPLRKEAHGESHPDVAVTLSNLALRHNALGDRAAAIDFSQQALDMWRAELDPQDGRLGFALNNLGGYLLEDGQAGAAVPLLTEALQIFEANFAHLDDVHPQVINTAFGLALAHLVAGDAQAARALADRFDLDWEKRLAHAAQYPQTESPEPG